MKLTEGVYENLITDGVKHEMDDANWEGLQNTDSHEGKGKRFVEQKVNEESFCSLCVRIKRMDMETRVRLYALVWWTTSAQKETSR